MVDVRDRHGRCLGCTFSNMYIFQVVEWRNELVMDVLLNVRHR